MKRATDRIEARSAALPNRNLERKVAMSRTKSTKPPSYRLHKASKQAVVTINGKDHYLGAWESPDSRLRYERLIIAWMAGEPAPAPEASPADVTIAELCVFYLREAETHYQKDGVATSELSNVKRAIRCLVELYAALPAREFSPLKLKACRAKLIADGLCRTNVNRYAGTIVRILAHGVENEMVPGDVHHALKAVRPLQKDRSPAREAEPVDPVSDADVEATVHLLSEPYRTMVRLQGVVGCRPGELTGMTAADIDRTGAVWVYRPRSHKTQHHGKSRVIPIGPQGQLLLRPFLDLTLPTVLVFRNNRFTKISRNSYEQAIKTACRKAGVENWSPNQLRHSAATRIREAYGIEAASIILGHANMSTTEIYAERNLKAAVKIAGEVG